jgi:hypothetical protein
VRCCDDALESDNGVLPFAACIGGVTLPSLTVRHCTPNVDQISEAHNGLGSSRIPICYQNAVWWVFWYAYHISSRALDDEGLIPGVAYYWYWLSRLYRCRFYIQQGQSPYERDTYRYTVSLPLALLPLEGGRYLRFADGLRGWMITIFDKGRSSFSKNLLSIPIISPHRTFLSGGSTILSPHICTRDLQSHGAVVW